MTPVCIHIGFPKAGSTFLQQYFESHPDVDYSRADLNEYRETGVLNLPPDVDRMLKNRIISGEQLSVWAGGRSKDGIETYSMDYDIKAHQRYVATQLKHLFPEARILIVVRSPHSLLLSLYSQYLLSAGFIGLNRFLKESGDLIFRLYDYEYIIAMYQQFFGLENVLILPYEQLKDDHHGFLSAVNGFFGLSEIDFKSDLVNRSIPQDVWWLLRPISSLFRLSIRLFPLKKQREIYDAYTERLYRAKETWLPNFLAGKTGLRSFDYDLINDCVQKHYKYFEGLGSHANVLAYIDKYR